MMGCRSKCGCPEPLASLTWKPMTRDDATRFVTHVAFPPEPAHISDLRTGIGIQLLAGPETRCYLTISYNHSSIAFISLYSNTSPSVDFHCAPILLAIMYNVNCLNWIVVIRLALAQST
jgi:hypothetical protein